MTKKSIEPVEPVFEEPPPEAPSTGRNNKSRYYIALEKVAKRRGEWARLWTGAPKKSSSAKLNIMRQTERLGGAWEVVKRSISEDKDGVWVCYLGAASDLGLDQIQMEAIAELAAGRPRVEAVKMVVESFDGWNDANARLAIRLVEMEGLL